MNTFYQTDLAYVHDTGFSDFASHAAGMIINQLNEKVGKKGLVIDLGCGSGVIAQELLKNNFEVLGIDQSAELIEIAKKKAPTAKFIIDSFFNTDFPHCISVISTSECLNYATEKNNAAGLKEIFLKIYNALQNGGLFIFDMIGPHSTDKNYMIEYADWTMFVHVYTCQDSTKLVRDVTLFRKIGDYYRKSTEQHKVNLYSQNQITTLLKDVGFEVSLFKEYGDLNLEDHHTGFLCRKTVD